MTNANLRLFMQPALDLAIQASAMGGVPVGAVVVLNGQVIGQGSNPAPGACDPTAHAEILAIRQAAKHLGRDRLNDCDLWVTLEPCAMCAGAIAHARIARLYFGAEDKKGGAVLNGPRLFSQSTIHHRPEIYHGILEQESQSLLLAFFAARR
jgi:tRNA(adenine34) deaminase